MRMLCGTILAAALGLAAHGAVDRSAMSEAYWEIWDAAEETRIDKDIEANRKADGAFAVPAPDGTEVEVEQICHEFRFGAQIFNFNQLGSTEKNDRYKAMFGDGGLFNQATVPFYWRDYEPLPGVARDGAAYEDSEEYWNGLTREEAMRKRHWRRPAPAPIIEFCRERGMTVYGHVLIYGEVWGMPPWMWYHCCPQEERAFFRDWGVPQGAIPTKERDEKWTSVWKDVFSALGADGVAEVAPKFAANVRELFRKRVEGVAKRFGDRVDSWECVNESWRDWAAAGRSCATGCALVCGTRDGIMPGDYQLHSFLDASKAFPALAELNVNDNIISPEYRDMVCDLIAHGAKVDAVGCQMHIFNRGAMVRLAAGDVQGLSCAGLQPWTPQSIREGLDLMAETGRPIHVSEITIPAPGTDAKSRAIQAVAARNFYRACFAHKAVKGITWWNTVDGGSVAGEPTVSGLLDENLERKPAYDALDELINHEWKTKIAVESNDGSIAFRGFRGLYRLSWTCPRCGQRHVRYVTLTGEGAREAAGSWTCAACRPIAREFLVDGKDISLAPGETLLDLAKIYPGDVSRGSDGERWATLEFAIVAENEGEYALEMHNDYYGELSVNDGEAVKTQGPFSGFETIRVMLRKGENRIRFRTRAGSGGKWTTGFRMPRNSGAKFNFGKN